MALNQQLDFLRGVEPGNGQLGARHNGGEDGRGASAPAAETAAGGQQTTWSAQQRLLQYVEDGDGPPAAPQAAAARRSFVHHQPQYDDDDDDQGVRGASAAVATAATAASSLTGEERRRPVPGVPLRRDSSAGSVLVSATRGTPAEATHALAAPPEAAILIQQLRDTMRNNPGQLSALLQQLDAAADGEAAEAAQPQTRRRPRPPRQYECAVDDLVDPAACQQASRATPEMSDTPLPSAFERRPTPMGAALPEAASSSAKRPARDDSRGSETTSKRRAPHDGAAPARAGSLLLLLLMSAAALLLQQQLLLLVVVQRLYTTWPPGQLCRADGMRPRRWACRPYKILLPWHSATPTTPSDGMWMEVCMILLDDIEFLSRSSPNKLLYPSTDTSGGKIGLLGPSVAIW